MAALKLAAPGKMKNEEPIGPCIDITCDHSQCALTRKQVAKVCGYCNKPIGYETLFYAERMGDEITLSHAICLDIAIEKERAI